MRIELLLGQFCENRWPSARAATQLDELPRTGEIHGDLKLENLLIANDGIRIIDSLKLASGKVSPALTTLRAVPKQILGKAVTTAADQYALAVIICLLIGDLYIDSDPQPPTQLTPEGLNAWCTLLDRCLRYDPDARFLSMADFAGETRSVLEKHPVSGHLEMLPDFGSFQSVDAEAAVFGWTREVCRWPDSWFAAGLSHLRRSHLEQ